MKTDLPLRTPGPIVFHVLLILIAVCDLFVAGRREVQNKSGGADTLPASPRSNQRLAVQVCAAGGVLFRDRLRSQHHLIVSTP